MFKIKLNSRTGFQACIAEDQKQVKPKIISRTVGQKTTCIVEIGWKGMAVTA
jgi:hypothetical protein